MSETWIREYILLAFRIHKVVQARYGSPFVEAYYGPSAWQSQAKSEPEMEASDLVRQAMILADALPIQGFASNRMVYLGKHVKAMEMLCRKLCGEFFLLEEEAKYYLDIHPTWTPEEQFELAHALYETVLPGTGSLAERRQEYRRALAFPQEQQDLLTEVIDQAFAEARQRTYAFIDLPEGEMVELKCFSDKEYDAAARYQGNYCTRIEMNLRATSADFSRLFDHKVCHEAYPGHHTEYVLKEQQLARKERYAEQTIVLTLCPQCVITEGVAMVAHEMIFSEGEAEQWLTKHVYRSLQKEVDPVVLLRLRQASEMLQGVWDNAAMLLDEGRPEADVVQYFTKYMLLAEDRAVQMVASLKHPIWGRYQLTYTSGQKLMRRWLQRPDKLTVFHRFLTEQFTPSQLEEDILPFQVESF